MIIGGLMVLLGDILALRSGIIRTLRSFVDDRPGERFAILSIAIFEAGGIKRVRSTTRSLFIRERKITLSGQLLGPGIRIGNLGHSGVLGGLSRRIAAIKDAIFSRHVVVGAERQPRVLSRQLLCGLICLATNHYHSGFLVGFDL